MLVRSCGCVGVVIMSPLSVCSGIWSGCKTTIAVHRRDHKRQDENINSGSTFYYFFPHLEKTKNRSGDEEQHVASE